LRRTGRAGGLHAPALARDARGVPRPHHEYPQQPAAVVSRHSRAEGRDRIRRQDSWVHGFLRHRGCRCRPGNRASRGARAARRRRTTAGGANPAPGASHLSACDRTLSAGPSRDSGASGYHQGQLAQAKLLAVGESAGGLIRKLKTLSVIVPMLNEAALIASTLRALRRGAPDAEIVVVDGGSADLSVATAQPSCDTVIGASRGRAHQMNAGARESHGEVLVFVHADTIVPSTFAADIASALSDPAVVGGRFDVKLDSSAIPYRIIGAMISLRSRISRTGTGDQAIFVRRDVFDRLGGFPELELCEDLEFARRLKR